MASRHIKNSNSISLLKPAISLDGSFLKKPLRNNAPSVAIDSKAGRLKLRFIREKLKIERAIGDKKAQKISLLDERGKKRLYVEELPEIRVSSVVEGSGHANLNKTHAYLKSPKPQLTSLSPRGTRPGVTFNGIVKTKTNTKLKIPQRKYLQISSPISPKHWQTIGNFARPQSSFGQLPKRPPLILPAKPNPMPQVVTPMGVYSPNHDFSVTPSISITFQEEAYQPPPSETQQPPPLETLRSQVPDRIDLLLPELEVHRIKHRKLSESWIEKTISFKDDPYHALNICHMKNITLFRKILDQKIEETFPQKFPFKYIFKFDREHCNHQISKEKFNQIKVSKVDVKQRQSKVEPKTTLTWSWKTEFFDKASDIKNSFYPVHELPKMYYIMKKSLILNPIYIKQKIKDRVKNVIVLNFEGVIGDFFKKNMIDISWPALYLRPGAIRGLKKLQEHYQLILISGFRTNRILKIISKFNKEGVQLTAAYQLRKPRQNDDEDLKCNDLKPFLDYTRIYDDLALKAPFNSKLIVISPVNLSNMDIAEREGMELVMEKICGKNQIFLEKWPVGISQNYELPICLGVPNPRSQISGEVLNMNAIADTLIDLAENTTFSSSWIDNLKRWQGGYPSQNLSQSRNRRSNYMSFTKLIETDVIQNMFLSAIRDSPPSFEMDLTSKSQIVQLFSNSAQFNKNNREFHDIGGEFLEMPIWPMHKTVIPNWAKISLINQFIILPVDVWLNTDMVGSYELVEFENVALIKGTINLLQFNDVELSK